MSERKLIIAIDGPAGSGKSTTAKLVAERLGYVFLDTGAMYRAVTLKVLREQVDLQDEAQIAARAECSEIVFKRANNSIRIFLNDEDVSEAIRKPDVTRYVSQVSSYPSVRKILVEKQKELARERGIVAEGRDMGTVVFPGADLKIFLVASLAERVRRRRLELEQMGLSVDSSQLARDIRHRDDLDSQRASSPLKQAEDAIVVDTTHLTIGEQVDFIVQKARDKLN